ncbi:MAG: hypothetical protein LBE02_01230 [Spirochaetaceae bacterium]|nr:hypothetical protein [Spirochaetaceae bacterium]
MLKKSEKLKLGVVFLSMLVLSALPAAEETEGNAEEGAAPKEKRSSVYSVFVNVAAEDFYFPLFGLVNIARGDQRVPQFGLININGGTLRSGQMGLFNTAGRNLLGLQLGLANAAGGELRGAQMGLANFAFKGVRGVQLGLANISTKSIRGMQFGLFNYADSAEGGVPVGLLSVVRHGGYRALELSFAEALPVNLAFKIGTEKFYSSFIFSFYPDFKDLEIAFGFGAGSIIPVTRYFFINPEINNVTPLTLEQNFLSFTPLAGFNLGSHISIVAGPSLAYIYTIDDGDIRNPLFTIGKKFNDEHSLLLGVKAGVRIRF